MKVAAEATKKLLDRWPQIRQAYPLFEADLADTLRLATVQELQDTTAELEAQAQDSAADPHVVQALRSVAATLKARAVAKLLTPAEANGPNHGAGLAGGVPTR